MSKDEIKYEINKVLDQLSDKSLEEILNLLKGAKIQSTSPIFRPDALNKILSQDSELLQKLAQ